MEEFSMNIVSYVLKKYDDYHNDVSEADFVSICGYRKGPIGLGDLELLVQYFWRLFI
jgi:hypothetical protein